MGYLYVGDGYPGRVLGTLGRTGKLLGQFDWVHGIAYPSENVLYIADENNWRVQKLLPHPGRASTTALNR